MDNIESIVEVIFVILFLFGRFILKMLVGGSQKASRKTTPQPAQPKIKSRPVSVPQTATVNTAPSVSRSSASPAAKRPGIAKWTRRKEVPSLGKMCDTVKAAFEVQKERAKAIANTCNYRNFTVLKQDALRYANQIEEFITQLGEAQDQKSLNRNMVDNNTNALQIIDDRLAVFEATLNERTASYSAHFNCADQILADLADRCRRQQGGESICQYLFGGVMLDPQNIKGGLYGVSVPQRHLIRPRDWSLIGGALHEAIAVRGKYGTKISGELGLPQAASSMSYFISTGRLMSAGVISSWMDWIYADVAATLQLGEAYAWTMLTKCEQSGDSGELTRFSINRRSQTSGMPLLSRLITIHATLQQMAVFDTEAFSARIAALLSVHPDLTIDIEGRGDVPLSNTSINGDLFQVAAALGNTPLSALNGYTIEEIAGTDFSTKPMSHIHDIADGLRKGKPQYGVRPYRLIIAIHMALQKERNAEARIEAAALESLHQQKHTAGNRTLKQPDAGHKTPSTLKDVFTPAFLPQTVMIGALSKNRGGISQRGS